MRKHLFHLSWHLLFAFLFIIISCYFWHRFWWQFSWSFTLMLYENVDLGTRSKPNEVQNGTQKQYNHFKIVEILSVGMSMYRLFCVTETASICWCILVALWLTLGIILIPTNTKMLTQTNTWHQNANKNISQKSLFLNAFWHPRNKLESHKPTWINQHRAT